MPLLQPLRSSSRNKRIFGVNPESTIRRFTCWLNPVSDKSILRKSEKRNTEILLLRADGHTAKLGRAIPMLVDCFVAAASRNDKLTRAGDFPLSRGDES